MHIRNLIDLELEIPDYMTSLTQEEIDVVLESVDRFERIISCGVLGDSLRFITGSGQVREIVRNGKLSPGRAFPCNGGRNIKLTFTESGERIVPSSLVLKYSKNSLNNSELFVNNSYVCDAEIDDYEFPREHNED